MPWVCSFCSTNNEDENELCFVCDAPRPVAPPPSPAPAATTGVCTLTKTRVRSLGLSGNVVVPEEFNAIGESAFAGRRDITSVTLHGGVKKIGPSAFSGCHSLTRISGGEGLTSIGARAFYDCPALGGPRPHARYMADDAFGMPVSRPAPTPPPPRVTPAPPPPPPRVTPTPRPSPRVTTTATPTPRPSATSDTAANIGIAILFLVLCAAVVFLVLSLVRFVNADPLPGCLWLGASLTLTLLLASIAVYGNTGESSLVPHIAALPVVALNLLLFGAIGAGYTLIGAIVFGAHLLLSLSLFIFAICDYFRSDRLYVKERLLHGTAAALSVFLFVLSVL